MRKVVDLDTALESLFQCQGDLDTCLRKLAGDEPTEQRKVLFEVMYELKAPENEDKLAEWETLIEVGMQVSTLQIEAEFVKSARRGEAKDPKAILERLLPERWGRRSNVKPDGRDASIFDAAVQSYNKGDKDGT